MRTGGLLKFAPLCIAVCVCLVPAWAQPPTPGVVAPDGALAGRIEELCARVEKRRESNHIPGLSLAIVKDDKLILARGFGLRDVEKNIPVSEDSLFAIGSSTKAFTSLLCAMMVDEGKLNWDEPVTTYLPGFKLKDETASAQATLRDLLSHRTGLSRTDMLWAGGAASRELILSQISRAQLKDPFRAKFNYNNVMFLAAGTAAGKAAGSDWDTLVKSRIFEPLGMKSTTTRIEDMIPDPRAVKGYRWDEEKKSYTFLPMRNLAGIGPAGAINSNVIDMSNWVRLQLGRGSFQGKKLVSREQLEATWEKQIDIAPSVGYALGWMVHDWNGKRVVEHGGNIDGFAAEVGMLPDENVGFVLLANVSATPLQSEIQTMVWEAVFPPDAAALAGAVPAAEMGEYLGKYRFDMLGVDCTVLTRDGKLCVDVPQQTVYELKWPDAEGKWVFAITDAIKVRFERDAAKAVIAMTMFQSGMEFRLPKAGAPVIEEKSPMAADELRSYTGTYSFEPRNEKWPVVLKDGRLAIDIPKQRLCVLEWPDEKGRWAFQIRRDLAVEFAKSEGAVESMTLFEGGQTFVMPRLPGTEAPALPSLDELMKKRQTAGGGDSVATLGNVRVTGNADFVHQGIDGTITMLFSGTDRFVLEMDMGAFGFIRRASDGNSVWNESIGEEFAVLEGKNRQEALHQAIISSWADIRPQFDEVEVTGADTVDGQPVAVVRAAMKDGSARTQMYLSLEHGLPLRVVATVTLPGIGALPIKITYSDYRDIGAGVLLPFKTTVETDFNGDTVMTYDKVETKVAAGPEAYVLRPRRK